MNIFKRIANLLTGGGGADNRFVSFYLLNHRCNEPLEGRVDLFSELSLVEDGKHAFYARKVVHTSGQNRCFSQVEAHLWFNKSKQMVEYEVIGGRWLDADEYEAELARFNAPPEEDDESSEEVPDDREGTVESTSDEVKEPIKV